MKSIENNLSNSPEILSELSEKEERYIDNFFGTEKGRGKNICKSKILESVEGLRRDGHIFGTSGFYKALIKYISGSYFWKIKDEDKDILYSIVKKLSKDYKDSVSEKLPIFEKGKIGKKEQNNPQLDLFPH